MNRLLRYKSTNPYTTGQSNSVKRAIQRVYCSCRDFIDVFVDLTSSVWEFVTNISGNANGDRFGTSIALNNTGEIVAVGAPWESGYESDGTTIISKSGVVRVYMKINDTQQQIGNNITGLLDSYFGSSIAINGKGDILAIAGVNADNNNLQDVGYVSIYRYDSTLNTWNKIGNSIYGENSNDKIGESITMNDSGSIIAISGNNTVPGTLNDQLAMNSYVKIYENQNDVWTLIGTLNSVITGDLFGTSISLNSEGNIIAIGAPGHYEGDPQANDVNEGIAYVYRYNSSDSTWSSISFIDSENGFYLQKGSSVSLNGVGNVLAVGIPGHDEDTNVNNPFGSSEGKIEIYDLFVGSWRKIGTIVGSDNLGYMGQDIQSLSLNNSGNILAIGSSSGNDTKGLVSVYQYNGTSWNKIGSDITDDNNGGIGTYFGKSVCLDKEGTIIAIGAPETDLVNPGFFQIWNLQ